MDKKKYIVVGKRDDGENISDIVYAKNESLAVRGFNQYHIDDEVNGEVICQLPYQYNTETILFNNHTLEEVEYYKTHIVDYNCGGLYGNIDAQYVLSDLGDGEHWYDVEKYLPEDLCLKLIPSSGIGPGCTSVVLCKFDDGTMKFACRVTIDGNNYDEKVYWIEEWSKRQLKNAKSKFTSVGPAYHWQMPKEFADRVVAWRFFKEGESVKQYM